MFRRARPNRLTLALVLALLPVLLAAAPAPAGGGAQGDSSFASAFFWSTRTNVRGEQSLEILGSLIIWFLLALSVFSLGMMGMMALTNQRKNIVPESVVDEVKRLLGHARFREAIELTAREGSFFSRVLHAGLNEANHGYSAMIRALEQTSDELTTNRLRRIEYLNVLGQVSPMLGLLGTVYGMILAFGAIVASGGNADPIQLAGGIGTALTTTFWGLVVAIPALTGYAIIRNRIDELTTDGTLRAEELVNQFRPRPGGKSASGASPSSSGEARPKASPQPRPGAAEAESR